MTDSNCGTKCHAWCQGDVGSVGRIELLRVEMRDVQHNSSVNKCTA